MPIKGIDFLLEAIRNIDVSLLIIGKGSEFFDELKENYSEEFSSGKIVYQEVVSDDVLHSAYSCADLFVLPSRQDSFPLVVIEAMAHRLPVIISDKVGITEVIRDGVEGFVVPTGDVNSLRTQISKLVRDERLRERMGESAYNKAKSLTQARTVDNYIRFFKSKVGLGVDTQNDS